MNKTAILGLIVLLLAGCIPSTPAPNIPTPTETSGIHTFPPEPTSEAPEEPIRFDFGSKVAIDNIRVTQGGTAPWRRDFDNGFVLVNPLHKPFTFTMAEIIGDLERTGIKRILGTQAPEVNNGQEVTGPLILEPFDAIILLAKHIPGQ